MYIFHILILLFYCGLVSFSTFSKENNFVILSYSLLSIPLFLLYYLYNAADVGFTEISIGAFLSFFFVYIAKTKAELTTNNDKQNKQQYIKLIFYIALCVALFCVLLYIAILLENFTLTENYSLFYAKQSYLETKIPNTVTAILASYRGFDTMGETLIIAISGLGVYYIKKN